MAMQARKITVFPLTALMAWAATPGALDPTVGEAESTGIGRTGLVEADPARSQDEADGNGERGVDLGYQPVLLVDRTVKAARIPSFKPKIQPAHQLTACRLRFDIIPFVGTAFDGDHVMCADHSHGGMEHLPHAPPVADFVC